MTRTNQVEGLNPNGSIFQSASNMLTVVDCFNVPLVEESIMESAIIFGAKNDTNLVFLNNLTNI
jgi:hypothetical protein